MTESTAPRLIFYSRESCSLCEKAKAEIRAAFREVEIEEIDVDSDPALKALYGEEVPVGVVGEEKAFKYHVDIRRLRRLLKRG
jgi:hypothetical protein